MSGRLMAATATATVAALRRGFVRCGTVRPVRWMSDESRGGLTHVGADGQARMVDVSHKAATKRTAVAEAVVDVGAAVLRMIEDNEVRKGDVLSVAQVAGIQAAKQTSGLIPLCHPVALDQVAVRFTTARPGRVVATATAVTTAATGVEMEALTAASVAALTVYDMCKAANKGIVIRGVRLLEKTGGKSKDYRADSVNVDGVGIE